MNPIEQESAHRLHAALVRPIPEEVAGRHLAAMRAVRRRPRRWPTILAAAVAVLMMGGAVALPGHVDLPEVVETQGAPTAIPGGGHGTGLDLQDPPRPPWVEAADAAHGGTVSGIATASDLTGKERGAQVSEAASAASEEHRKDGEHRPAENPVGKAPGTGDGGKPADTPGNGTGEPENTPGKGPGG